jgi:hypothetical protein
MHKYTIWGADISSDQELDLDNEDVKRQLIEAKVEIDKEGVVTTRFIIIDGMLYAHCDDDGSVFATIFKG